MDFARRVLRLSLLSTLLGGGALARQAPPASPPTAAPKSSPVVASPKQASHPDLPLIDEFVLRSECVSEFWKRDRSIQSGVVRPLDWKEGEKLPVAYDVHGFGGSHLVAWQRGPLIQKAMQAGTIPRMLYVFLNAQYEWGHHEFADSRCNGPWGKALTTEFIPALEKKFGAVAEPAARLLTGHSSGGWSVLWLQVTYPDFFGGCWATSPDSVDFRDFTGIDIYSFENAYTDPDGKPIMLVRQRGQFVSSIQQYVGMERAQEPVGGQFFSFNAVFSEKGPDGKPKQLFDWESGAIDADVADSWRPYDISLNLRENWKTLGPKVAGKVHVWCGTIDTYRLEGALTLMKEELDKLHADVDILLVPGRDHGSIFAPHPEYWPKGMLDRIYHEMAESFAKHSKEAAPAR
jgi:S-formylglutathione hydrolase FrmB